MHTAKSIIIIILFISFGAVAQKHNHPSPEKYSGKVVIFIGPTQTEYDSLAMDESSGIAEVVGDFNICANKVVTYLKSKKIKSVITSARSVIIRYSGKGYIFDRIKSNSPIGIILSDGVQQPKVFLNVMTDTELKEEIESFYNVK